MPVKRSWTVVDVGAAAAVLLALAGVAWSPKLTSAVAQVSGAVKPVQVSVDVRGIPVADPAALIRDAVEAGSTSIVIRNQPHGRVAVQEVVDTTRRLVAVQPDGSVVSADNPNNARRGSLDARFLLEGQGRLVDGGVVFGNQKLKIGSPVELEGPTYRINGTVSGISAG
ncbi:DUF4330 domain-containing protein [Synechococcus sp. RSCCF101]|uniref:DUF4330 domain-containing protein n=1 Tax=Synechococcus sp. RSCCF101 TaxID=2511069 RepID=UPI001243EEDD|nr:DUF4330 domain-containing protein [Synechococcus sp. RSCCF101]QEY31717.1 DUF4330 domain-containing protein [Synechococcus sp. RSCCF101]